MYKKEIERRFLVNKDKLKDRLNNLEKYKIIQAYLNIIPAIRVRKKDDEYYFCIKNIKNNENSNLIRDEYEISIDEKSFNHLLNKCDGIILQKIRYIMPICQNFRFYNIEIDVFEKDYEGLIIAEVEFESERDANEFIVPDFFGIEITNDKKLTNAYLSGIKEI